MSDPAVFFVALTALAVVACGIIWKWRLFEVPHFQGQESGRLALMTPLIAFLLFMGACSFVPNATAKIISYTDTHGYSSFSQKEADNFAQLMALVVSCILLMGFSRIHPEDVRGRIWGYMGACKPFLMGLVYCLLTYPIVMSIVQGAHLVIDWFGINATHEQVALVQLKSLMSYPWLFWTFAVATITIIPVIEEFLFRGLLQNYFTNFCGARLSIILTSILFAFFHYSALQGPTNIELMIGLFIYSYFIGLFYMREGSLWTAIAMHAAFNALTIFIMFYVLNKGII